MGTWTPNLNLYKPDASDPFANFREEFNDNMDKLDNGGGGSGGHTIIDENGSTMPTETALQFTGAVSVTDDNVNGRTVVNVSGGSNLILDAKIYSDNEKVVGVWRDKKPLYQKTFYRYGTISSNSSISFADVSALSIETLVSAHGTAYESGWGWCEFPEIDMRLRYDEVSEYIKLDTETIAFVDADAFVTIQYTKTTDVAGSGGYEAYGFSPVIYSDVERVIGVWRDNKPLYQKTIVNHSSDVSGTGILIDVSSLNIDSCVSIEGVCDRNVAGVGTLIYEMNSYEDSGLRTYLGYSKFNQNIQYTIRFYNTETTSTQIITIRYTKTTDVAGSGDYNTYGVPTHHYSTSEQVIGTWIDGKPLYSIVVSGLNIPVQSGWSSTFATSLNIENLASAKLYDITNPTNPKFVTVDKVQVLNGGVRISNNYALGTITHAYLEYTKTTD